MRFARVRVTALSVLGGGFLTLGVIAGLPGAAQADALRLNTASPSPGTSTSAMLHQHQLPGTAGF